MVIALFAALTSIAVPPVPVIVPEFTIAPPAKLTPLPTLMPVLPMILPAFEMLPPRLPIDESEQGCRRLAAVIVPVLVMPPAKVCDAVDTDAACRRPISGHYC